MQDGEWMRKIAVIFPGIGYTKDRPLLYFSGKQALKCGYELHFVEFSGIEWSKEKLKDRGFLLEVLEKSLKKTEEALDDLGDMSDDEVIFISKSIGTVVAAAYARKKSINPRQICFSPLEMISGFVEEDSGILFYGDKDPVADHNVIEKIAGEKHLETYRIPDGNHSLETGDFCKDMDNIRDMILRVTDIMTDANLYRIPVKDMSGMIKDLSEYRGKVLLVVNTATGCGFTPQYEALERFYRTYKEQGFAVLDFPCNQFGKQAPGTREEIHSFCTARYDITFEQFAKTDVNGPDESELFAFLKKKKGFGGFGDSPEDEFLRKKLSKEVPDYEHTPDIKWNFTKFVIDRKGKVVARFEPTADMNRVEECIRSLL